MPLEHMTVFLFNVSGGLNLDEWLATALACAPAPATTSTTRKDRGFYPFKECGLLSARHLHGGRVRLCALKSSVWQAISTKTRSVASTSMPCLLYIHPEGTCRLWARYDSILLG